MALLSHPPNFFTEGLALFVRSAFFCCWRNGRGDHALSLEAPEVRPGMTGRGEDTEEDLSNGRLGGCSDGPGLFATKDGWGC